MTAAHGWRRAAAAMTGGLFGLGAGALLITLNWGALTTLLLVAAAAAWSAQRVGARDRFLVAAIVIGGLALRAAIGQLIYVGSEALGRGGFITGDDADYALMASAVSGYLTGHPIEPYVPPLWSGNDYLVGTFVYLETAVFLVFGRNVPVMLALNAGMAAASSLIVYTLLLRLFGRRSGLLALAIVTFFPSLVLWSSLNLKDAAAALITVAVFWELYAFAERPRAWLFAALFVTLVPLEGLRKYLFAGLALVIPIGIALLARTSMRRRASWALASSVTSAALLLLLGYSGWANPASLSSLELIRAAMSSGARTGFSEQLPLNVREGSTFVVPGSGSSPLPSPEPGSSPSPAAVVHVRPGTTLRLGDPAAPAKEGTVHVRPGTVVVIGAPETTPAPVAEQRTLRFPDDSTPIQVGARQDQVVPGTNDGLILQRTLSHVPRGIAYALFAPFPWDIRRAADLAAFPEMMLWYLALPAAVMTVVKDRRKPEIAPIALFILGTLAIFVLAEGNVGILFRHRGMIVPYVFALATPTFGAWAEWSRAALVARGRRNTHAASA